MYLQFVPNFDFDVALWTRPLDLKLILYFCKNKKFLIKKSANMNTNYSHQNISLKTKLLNFLFIEKMGIGYCLG